MPPEWLSSSTVGLPLLSTDSGFRCCLDTCPLQSECPTQTAEERVVVARAVAERVEAARAVEAKVEVRVGVTVEAT